jgi:hypothetical protein
MKSKSAVGKLASGPYQHVLNTAALAQPVVRASKRGAVVFGVSALVVWLLWFVPNSFSPLLVLGSAVAFLVLAMPAAIQVAFSAALEEFLEIPAKLQAKAAEGAGHIAAAAGHAATASSSTRGKKGADVGEESGVVAPSKGLHLVRLLRSLYYLGRAGLEAKGTLLGATAIVRLLNPIVPATIFASVIVGAVLVVMAVVGLLLRIF